MTGERISPEACQAEREAVASLPEGAASLAAKSSMALGDDYPVKLIVGRKDRQTQNEEALAPIGEVSSADIRLGVWICAELQATNFSVRGEQRQCKNRGGSPQVSFSWEVVPEKSGRHILVASVQSFTERDGAPFDQLDSNQVAVEVETSLTQDIEESGGLLERIFGSMTGALIALAGLIAAASLVIWRMKKFGQKPDGKPA